MDANGVEQAIFPLPVGTVTFMLTDIEGSTRLWESTPGAMSAAVARHYQLLDEVISRRGGVRPLEQGEGDSVVAAFTRASGAVAAALDVQHAFRSEEWPKGALLRLRIALHTAEAQLRDEGNYFGRALNRCARSRPVAPGRARRSGRAVPDDTGLGPRSAARTRRAHGPRRASAARPRTPEHNAPAVAQICYDLDGIPLAIELAAARMLAPEQIAHALSDRFHLLTGGARTVLPRHQTLKASIDWSHELLGDEERALLRRLSMFVGGWTRRSRSARAKASTATACWTC
jgi:class 3 adenylate cyclase